MQLLNSISRRKLDRELLYIKIFYFLTIYGSIHSEFAPVLFREDPRVIYSWQQVFVAYSRKIPMQHANGLGLVNSQCKTGLLSHYPQHDNYLN